MAKYTKPKIKELKIIINSDEINDVCFNSDDYWKLVVDFSWDNLGFELNDLRHDVKRGLYGFIKRKGNNNILNIWASKNVSKEHVKIYPKDKMPQDNLDPAWSTNIKISEFEKMIKLKAFW